MTQEELTQAIIDITNVLERNLRERLIDLRETAIKAYTDEELRAELKRRTQKRKLQQEIVQRCRHCKHFGEVKYWGGDVPETERLLCIRQGYTSLCCSFFKSKNGKHYLTHSISQKACEHFEKYENKYNDETK